MRRLMEAKRGLWDLWQPRKYFSATQTVLKNTPVSQPKGVKLVLSLSQLPGYR